MTQTLTRMMGATKVVGLSKDMHALQNHLSAPMYQSLSWSFMQTLSTTLTTFTYRFRLTGNTFFNQRHQCKTLWRSITSISQCGPQLTASKEKIQILTSLTVSFCSLPESRTELFRLNSLTWLPLLEIQSDWFWILTRWQAKSTNPGPCEGIGENTKAFKVINDRAYLVSFKTESKNKF